MGNNLIEWVGAADRASSLIAHGLDIMLGKLTKKMIVRKTTTVRWTITPSHYCTDILLTLACPPLSLIKYYTKAPADVGPKGYFPCRLRFENL